MTDQGDVEENGVPLAKAIDDGFHADPHLYNLRKAYEDLLEQHRLLVERNAELEAGVTEANQRTCGLSHCRCQGTQKRTCPYARPWAMVDNLTARNSYLWQQLRLESTRTAALESEKAANPDRSGRWAEDFMALQDENQRLVEHHRECEKAGEAMAQVLRRLYVGPFASEAREAVEAWDARKEGT